MRFFSLLDSYWSGITDGSIHTLSISFDGHTKKVVDYYGREAGMPAKAIALEDLIDTVAGTDRWIKGDANSIVELKAEGWDFTGEDEEHQKAVADAALDDAERLASPGLFDQMLDAGARAKGRYGCEALFWAAGEIEPACGGRAASDRRADALGSAAGLGWALRWV